MPAYRPTVRALAAVGVLASWGGTLTWLGLRQLEGGSNAELSLLASRQLAPGEARFAIYSGAVQVGSAGITLDTLSPGYKIIETMTLETPADAGVSRAIRWTETVLNPDLTLRQVDSRFVKKGQRHEGLARYDDGRLSVRLASGGVGSVVTAVEEKPVPLVAMAWELALRANLQPTRQGLMRTLAGWPMASRGATWHVTGDSTAIFPDSAEIDPVSRRWKAVHYDTARVFRVVVGGPAGPYTMWVERTGTIAGIDFPFGTRWVRTDFNLAVSDFRRALQADSATVRRALPTLIPYVIAPSRIDTATADRAFVMHRASGARVDSRAVAPLSAGRQMVVGDTIRIRSTPFRSAQGGRPDMTSDPLAQLDAAPIVSLAQELDTGPADTALVGRIIAAVQARVFVDTSYDAPTDALAALRSGRARPDGISRLFVALARESGLLARYVVGFTLDGTDVLTHSWAEVWLAAAGGWVAVDPVLGRQVASTNLVRLGFAGSSHPEDLRIALSDIRLTPIAATRAP